MLTPKSVHPKSLVSGAHTYEFLECYDIDHWHDFVTQETQSLSIHNDGIWTQKVRDTQQALDHKEGWLGEATTQTLEALESYDTYEKPKYIRQVGEELRDYLAPYLSLLNQSVLPKEELAHNDMGLGVFDFERFASGMYPFIPVDTSTAVDTLVSQLRVALDDYQWASALRDVHLYFEERYSNYPQLTLYILAGGPARISGKDLLWTGLGASEVVKFLEAREIPVAVKVLFATELEQARIVSVVPAKRFQDSFRINDTLVLSSDPKYFRYRGFKGLIATANRLGHSIPDYLGFIRPDIGRAFVKAYDPQALIFEQSYSREAVKEEIIRVINQYQHNAQPQDPTTPNDPA